MFGFERARKEIPAEERIGNGIIEEAWHTIETEQEPHVSRENVEVYLNNHLEAQKAWREYSAAKDFSDEKKRELVRKLVNIYEKMEGSVMS
jgi:hypothetical protein